VFRFKPDTIPIEFGQCSGRISDSFRVPSEWCPKWFGSVSDGEIRFLKAFPNAEDALAEVPEICPDVLLMDINLPGMSGVECVQHIKAKCPPSGMNLLLPQLTIRRRFRITLTSIANARDLGLGSGPAKRPDLRLANPVSAITNWKSTKGSAFVCLSGLTLPNIPRVEEGWRVDRTAHVRSLEFTGCCPQRLARLGSQLLMRRFGRNLLDELPRGRAGGH
jgi:CheY-like chemotaxis protein